MRQLGDLLVWVAMIGVLVAVVYYTPQFAQYMSGENQSAQTAGSEHSLALRLIDSPDRAE